jgi:PIN domain nuclease of toxin-antitoxin system
MSASPFVLDASAILACLHREPGHDLVADALQNATCLVTAANHAEIIAKALDRGHSMAYGVVDITAADGTVAGQLRTHTRAAGLSLGDRLCLAVAVRFKAPVLTADRPWLALATTLALDIRCIRPDAH